MDILKIIYPQAVNFSIKGDFGNCEAVPLELIPNIIPALAVIQEIRTNTGVPYIVKSSYRSPEKNSGILGASKTSKHMLFNAIDGNPEGYQGKELFELYQDICDGKFTPEIVWNGFKVRITPNLMGLGIYDTFIHIDGRGLLGFPAARWDYRNVKNYGG